MEKKKVLVGGKFSAWETSRDGGWRICWGLLESKIITDYLCFRPDFMCELMDEVIELSWARRGEPTRAYHMAINAVRSLHLGEGWKVAHLVFYLGRNTKVLLKEGWITPVKDHFGRSLSDMSRVLKVDFRACVSFEENSPNQYVFLNSLEFYEEQKSKFILFCLIKRNEVAKIDRSKVSRLSTEILPWEILKIIGEFLFLSEYKMDCLEE